MADANALGAQNDLVTAYNVAFTILQIPLGLIGVVAALLETHQEEDGSVRLPEAVADRLRDAFLSRLLALSGQGMLPEMLEDMDYEAWLHQNASTPKAAERRWGGGGVAPPRTRCEPLEPVNGVFVGAV